MASKNTQAGYTLIETLVALTLLFILLFLVTELMPYISDKAGSELKLKAIIACKNQMEETLVTKNYTDLIKEIDKNLILNKNIEKQEERLLITIKVNQKKTDRELYTLKAFVQNTDF